MKKKEVITGKFTATHTKEQKEQMQTLEEELRWNRSKIIRLAVALMFETHKKNPKIYGA